MIFRKVFGPDRFPGLSLAWKAGIFAGHVAYPPTFLTVAATGDLGLAIVIFMLSMAIAAADVIISGNIKE